MKNKKGNLVIMGIVVVLVLALAIMFLWYVPRKPVRDVAKLEITSVDQVVDGRHVAITESIDTERLKTAMLLLRTSRIAKKRESFPVKDEAYEINFLYDGDKFGLVLGKPEVSFIYSTSPNGRKYQLENSDSWLELMPMILSEAK